MFVIVETRSPDISNPSGEGRRAKPVLVLVTLLTLFIFGVGCGEEPKPPPADILGHWSTSSPDYAGRTFEVRPDTLTIDLGIKNGVTVYSIINVVVEDGGKGRAYTIEYRDTYGEPGQMRLQEEGGGRMRIGHGDELWTRDGGVKGAASQPGRA